MCALFRAQKFYTGWGSEGQKKTGSDKSRFNVSFNCEGQRHKTVSTAHDILKREES